MTILAQHLFYLSPFAVATTLYGLAVLDCAFASYRCAGGKNAAIDKRKYYAVALLKGALGSNFAVAIAAALIAVTTNMQTEPLMLFTEAGRFALDVYIPYAVVVLTSLTMRAIPEADVRAVMQTVVLGPFTFIRPAIAFLGLAYAVWNIRDASVLIVGVAILTMMLLVEQLFERINRYPQFKHIAG